MLKRSSALAGPDNDPPFPEDAPNTAPDVEIPASSPSEVEPAPDLGDPFNGRPHDQSNQPASSFQE